MIEYNKEIAQAIDTVFSESDWQRRYYFSQEIGAFDFEIKFPGKMKSMRAMIAVGGDSYLTLFDYPFGGDTADREMMNRLSEFLIRENYGLEVGTFHMNWEDGVVSFRLLTSCNENLPTQEIVEDSIFSPLEACERCAEGLIAIIFQGLDVEEALNLYQEV